MKQETIGERAARLRIQRVEVSRRTGIAPHTVGRILNGQDGHMRSYQKILELIEQEELALRDALVARHGIPEQLRAAS